MLVEGSSSTNVSLVNGNFNGNRLSHTALVELRDLGSVSINNSTFRANRIELGEVKEEVLHPANAAGLWIRKVQGMATIQGCSFSMNKAELNAGGLGLSAVTKATVEDCLFEGNTAGSFGGGIGY